MENCIGNKRSREESPEESPESKRLHADADVLIGILEEDDVDAGERDPASLDLATVMKSLEEEIAMPTENDEDRQAEIGYLFEASDDDLGLPPPETAQAVPAAAWTEEDVEPAEGFDQIWGFQEEEIPLWYDELTEFGFPSEEKFGAPEDGGDGFAVSFDGGLFDSSDLCWRPESLPAQ
ncbi:uncharacterized protein LOC110025118 [Phalaenopsis equestris]|uniref:uncharacterized protein LOC110025118 n=1 Tax=Phalaenopsis equestris TaxID=78828 RepID=UPI0009E3AFB6|nr:uncharacterized protein LOC110025118 [Phalaenopsis equestris]